MNLHQLIEQYVAFRQALGECFQGEAQILRAFGRVPGAQAEVSDVRAEQVSAFLAGTGPLTSTWHKKHGALLGFYRYATSRGHTATTPLPAIVPKRPPPFVPYIYSQEELRRLLLAISSCQHPFSSVGPITVRTVVLLLYGCALRVREAINLNRADIDLTNAVLTVRRTKFYKSRLVPFGGQLGTVLTQYAQRPQTAFSAEEDQTAFFTSRCGARLKQATLGASFRRLRAQAGIRRCDGARYQPRLHDLRHSFAVHRVTSWYRQGADVQKLLPQLSVYLSMTAELLAEANARFERYATPEDIHD